MATFHRCYSAVGSLVDSLRVSHQTLKLPLVAPLQSPYLKDHRVGGRVRQLDVAVPHATRIHGIAEISVAGADDVERGRRVQRGVEAVIKGLVGVVAREAAHVARDGERGAQRAVQGPPLCLSEHFGAA